LVVRPDHVALAYLHDGVPGEIDAREDEARGNQRAREDEENVESPQRVIC